MQSILALYNFCVATCYEKTHSSRPILQEQLRNGMKILSQSASLGFLSFFTTSIHPTGQPNTPNERYFGALQQCCSVLLWKSAYQWSKLCMEENQRIEKRTFFCHGLLRFLQFLSTFADPMYFTKSQNAKYPCPLQLLCRDLL